MNAASPDPRPDHELGDERQVDTAASHSASPTDSAGSPDVSGLGSELPANGIDPSTFLQPVQEIGSQIGQLPNQLSQALSPALSGIQQPLSMLQGLASPAASGPAALSQMGGNGAPGSGQQLRLDPEKARAATSKAEAESAEHAAHTSGAPAAVGTSPTDAAVGTLVAKFAAFKAAGKTHAGGQGSSNAVGRHGGITLIDSADTKAAGEQASVREI
ncbi:Uncharacterised protein [Mycobacteroides abscessus subsp. abscessus]|uniref:hypothetical protein n=2 Tax=Mycobacteroides abscessus TaxID=36809 RepID=UPI000926B2A0|nr:hypothetical protein [Mycobacteroides abscessus]MBN7329457.1 hypothetical protein [Mycobacteroides abscessus subsp. abscessus]SHQ63587.1 Uncharacterised protein [Mycobacteroides abscessus subsp. abscessus]SHU49150.1 Uncharacterised protein [Mycobacteroides abscessus subsp. abscessus]SIG16581.1 Uncharacterised protein [Mycobacteroides abscessus subsp. abscessus]SIH18749.1 Uncharacterised protein [Mycobacteroides abscessus subsp. abscessus]